MRASAELGKKYFSDEKKRMAMGKIMSKYFEPWHGDYISQSLQGFQK